MSGGGDRSFGRNLASTLTGGVLAQGIVLAGVPVLSRLFDPDAFGVYGFYFGVAAVLSVAASLRLDRAIQLPEADADARDVLVAATRIALGISLALGVLAALVLASGIVEVELDDLHLLVLLVPVGVFADATQKHLTQWGSRTGQFDAIATGRVLLAVTLIGSQVAAGLLSARAASLVGGDVAGRLVGVAVLAFLVRRTIRAAGDQEKGGGDGSRRPVPVRRVLSEHRQFPLLAMPAGTVNALSAQITVPLAFALYDATVAGLLTLSLRALQTPTLVVSQNVTQVLYPAAMRAHRSGELAEVSVRVVRQLLAAGLGPALVLVLVGPDAFAFVLGDDWRASGEYAALFAPWYLLVLVLAPFANLVHIFDAQRADLGWQTVMLAGRSAALVGGALVGSATAGIAALAAWSALSWVAYGSWLLTKAGVTRRTLARVAGGELARTAPFVAPVAIAVGVGAPRLVALPLAGVCALGAAATGLVSATRRSG